VKKEAWERFEWEEVMVLFSIREAETMREEERESLLERINGLAEDFGRNYVIRKIALSSP
jgi:hypothetical protein